MCIAIYFLAYQQTHVIRKLAMQTLLFGAAQSRLYQQIINANLKGSDSADPGRGNICPKPDFSKTIKKIKNEKRGVRRG